MIYLERVAAPIQAVTVQAAVLRNLMPDLVLRPGQVLAARVAERAGSHGVLVLTGTPLVAELPEQLRAGESLRLTVREAGPERVVLQITPEAPPPPQPPPAAVPVALPGGALAHVLVEERDPDAPPDPEGVRTLALTYDSPTLGAIEFRLSLDPEAVQAGVRVGTGAPLALAEEARAQLQEALAGATERPAQVAVTARYEPMDFYA